MQVILLTIHEDPRYLQEGVAAELWQAGAGNSKDETVQACRPLSEQETKVLTLIARLQEKLTVTKRSELVKYAIEQGLL